MHGLLTAEVLPAAPAAPYLVWIACLFVVVGILFMLRKFLEALLGGIAHLIPSLPLIGNPAADLVHKAEQAVSSALGSAEAAVDRQIGAAFHQLAVIYDYLWREFKAHANLLYLLAALLGGQNFEGMLRHAVANLTHRIGGIEGTLTHVLHRAETLAKQAAHSVAQGVFPRLRSLEHDVTRTIPKEIRTARELAKGAEATAEKAWNLVKSKPWEIGTTAFAGAVAVALSSLGLGWVRCSKVGGLGRSICGLPSSLFNDLLGLLADFFILTNVCTLIPILETVASDVGTPLVEGLTYIGAGLCATGASVPAALTGPGIGKIPVYLA